MVKPATLEFFPKNGKYLSGRCRQCTSIRNKIRYERKKDEITVKNKEWREKNKEKMDVYVAEWHAKNWERVKEIKRQWYERNKDRQVDRDATNARRRERAKNDPSIRLHSNISRSLRNSILFEKNTSWHEILGYTTAELVRHIERQFNRWMSWGNYGTYWHIDHIIPLASFPKATSKDDPNLKVAWALSNLRPLKWKDNQEKSDKRLHLL